MEIALDNKELHEVLASLAVNRFRLLGRVRRAERKIGELQKIGGGAIKKPI